MSSKANSIHSFIYLFKTEGIDLNCKELGNKISISVVEDIGKNDFDFVCPGNKSEEGRVFKEEMEARF